MEKYNEKQNKIDRVAADIINLAKSSLIVNLRFMDNAISMLRPINIKGLDAVMVDGNNIGYDPIYLLKSYKKEKALTSRQYLHMVLHCVFQHYFVGDLIDRECWDLACDIAVESVINELKLKCVEIPQASYQSAESEDLKKKAGALTAEVLYRYLLDGNVSEKEWKTLKKVFTIDSHDIWYAKEVSLVISYMQSGSSSAEEDSSDSPKGNGGGSGKQREDDNDEKNNSMGAGQNSLEDWKNVAESIAMDMETFSKSRGDTAGNLTQNLRSVTREQTDYSEFLRKFAVSNEVMKINDDEFDYIFYTYGLSTYGNMPLIEPLEYKEIKQIKEFVIAIDTSGSTCGELVQAFVQKTYNILMQQESFASRINLYIVQCDAEIQDVVNITNRDDFEKYIRNMEIHGLGGTDFRPVFDFVNDLVEKKVFNNLKGIIYFTDGMGVFPIKAPVYETAFVYVDDDYNNYDVPSWAMKLILRPEEIEGDQ